MALDDGARHSEQMLRLHPEEPARLDHRLELGGLGGRERRGVGILREQRRRDRIDHLVGRLRRQDGRDQQLIRTVVVELDMCVGPRFCERRGDPRRDLGPDTFCPAADRGRREVFRGRPPMRCDRIIFSVVLAVASCASNKKEVESARHSQYDADFVVVYTAALDATRNLYPNLDENPGPGPGSRRRGTRCNTRTAPALARRATTWSARPRSRRIRTAAVAWAARVWAGGGASGASMAGMPTRLAYKRYFIRRSMSTCSAGVHGA